MGVRPANMRNMPGLAAERQHEVVVGQVPGRGVAVAFDGVSVEVKDVALDPGECAVLDRDPVPLLPDVPDVVDEVVVHAKPRKTKGGDTAFLVPEIHASTLEPGDLVVVDLQ